MLPIRSTRLPQRGAIRAVLRPQTSLVPLRPPPASAIRTLSSAPVIRASHGELKSRAARARGQARWNTSYERRSTSNFNVKQPEPISQILRRALRFSNVFKGQTLRTMFRDSPEETALALFL